MGKGRTRAVQKGVLLGQSSTNSPIPSSGSLNIPLAPVYYPTEDEFKDPLEFIYKIRLEAEPYGICKIVPPKSWKPPFCLDLNSFSFETKTQAIHQLQVRPASCDPNTFVLEYNRFLEEHCGKKLKKRVEFEGEELEFCKLFNAVKRYGGYDKVVKEKKWGAVSRFVKSGGKVSECGKHVLSQLYLEHLYDYEEFCKRLNKERAKSSKGGKEIHIEGKSQQGCVSSSCKRRRKNLEGERIEVCKVEEREPDQICEQCGSGLHEEVMLLCDRCNKGWHIYCLSPPLKQIPPGNWYCLECLNSDKDSFGFVPGKKFSLEAFRRLAERAKKKWFGLGSVSRVQLEKKFWEIVEGLAGEVEVMYGSDLDTSIYGSGFPRVNDERPSSVEAEIWDEYCASPWNLNNLPKLHGSMLRAVHHNIAGVMVPWLYIGMLFSSFCWHFEDHCFYSMNYHHWGEPKYWYSVPGNEASAFEKVMRNSLPDLFDAQPDLLFQLVTMLNPSVLVDNGIPVYSVLQEPGNFVITFPRSYHGGFNFGLNCAEAVNFAPADWLPHGRIGAALYKTYHKTAVLSHEELLCAVAKSDFDSKASPYLKQELHRIYDREKIWRERLWRNGIMNSSPMPQRKNPEYVGTEEDPMCIICQQYLYLSAVVCRCRPSTKVCLEHWQHLCECKPYRHRLLYRHTLADLKVLVLMTDKHDPLKLSQDRSLRKHLLPSEDSGSLTKKVKGSNVTLSELIRKWTSSSSKILKVPYVRDAYNKALKDAEQFLWAGPEMDPVRELVKELTKAQNWAEAIRDCILKIENWSASSDEERVHLEHVDSLLNCDSRPCNEPAVLKLKDYHNQARELSREVCSFLSIGTKFPVADWERLHTSVCSIPIYIDENKELVRILTSTKVWIDNVRKCMSAKVPAAVEIDVLYKLQHEISELPVQLPEVEMLLDLIEQVKVCQANCNEMLKGSISLKKLEAFLQDLDDYTINIPELKLLREYHSDAISWISRYNGILVGFHEREDQENVVNEFTCLQRDGVSLKVEVAELSLIEIELKKARCRANVQKALCSKMPIDYMQELINEAAILHIERERWFCTMSGELAAAMDWEERAKQILANDAPLSCFEDAIRTSEGLSAILPSFDAVNMAVSSAKSWLKESEPFLVGNSSVPSASRTVLKVEDLKELVSQSKLLRITLKEQSMLQTVLDNSCRWEQNASSLLQDSARLLNTDYIDDHMARDIALNIEEQVTELGSVINAGLSLGLNFDKIPKLQDAYSALNWCSKALTFRLVLPQAEEVGMLLKIAQELPVASTSTSLLNMLMDGLNWLKKAAQITVPCNNGDFKKSDAEEVLGLSLRLKVSFQLMVTQLVNALKKHDSWLEQVHGFFNLTPNNRSWKSLLHLKELSDTDAFYCPELDVVSSEVQKVELWRKQCEEVAVTSVGDMKMLIHALLEIGRTVDQSLGIYGVSKGCKEKDFCISCFSKFEDLAILTCSVCKDCYHLHCQGETLGISDGAASVCHYCHFLKSGKISTSGGSLPSFKRNRADLDGLLELLSTAEDFSLWIEEKDVLHQLVEKGLAFKDGLKEILDLALSHYGADISEMAQKLSTAMKIAGIAGISVHECNRKLELALARNSWRVRANKLLEGQQQVSIQQIQRHLKEGQTLCIPLEDYFSQKLADVRQSCMQWADKARKVSMDSGALGLDMVFELITEGEKLPVHFEKELKLLRDRSMLYCICRKPYDQRAMIACDKCDEWYHFDCVELNATPKIYICPACKVPSDDLHALSTNSLERYVGPKCEEPKTPPPRQRELKCKSRRHKCTKMKKLPSSAEDRNATRRSRGLECLLWRTKKPFRRVTIRRSQLECLTQFSHIPNCD